MTDEPDYVFKSVVTGRVYSMERKIGFTDCMEQRKTVTAPYQVGDHLWVKESHYAWGHWEKTQGLTKMGREKWRFVRDFNEDVSFDEPKKVAPDRSHLGWHKRPSMFMFRADSRLTLVVTDVRVQRLREISADDAKAEGLKCWTDGAGCEWFSHNHQEDMAGDPTDAFLNLWNSINDARGFGWEINPWVVAVTFETHKCNIDQMGKSNG